MGYTFEELQKLMNTVIEKLPVTVECMNKMRQTQLSEDEMIQFAMECVQSRLLPGQEVGVDCIELLNPTRDEDKGSDLWSVFNVVQEKVLAGDFQHSNKKGGLRKAREIKNFVKDQQINKELYSIALNYMN